MRLLRLLRQRVRRRLAISQVLRRGEQRFSADPRFNLRFADQGLAPRQSAAVDDTALLQRICDAWSKSMQVQPSASEAFQPHPWWMGIRETNLGPVTRALAAYDFDSLRRMYANFFRDRCSAGLTGMPLARIEINSPVGNRVKELYLIDALHRVDVWTSRTNGRFPLAALTPPVVGNPLGVVIDGVFVRNGSEDQHYCAQRIIDLLGSSDTPVVAEIGGGFGGMPGYLTRDCPRVTYINFDLPETIALASYYLLSAFPDVKATLYGEAELNAETLRDSRIILMPGFAMPQLPAGSVDVAFNARILSDLSLAALHQYLGDIVRTTRGHLLHLNRTEGSVAADTWLTTNAPDFKLVEKRQSEWNNSRTLRPNEIEYLYERQIPRT